MNNSNILIVGTITKPLEVKKVSTASGKKNVGNMTVCSVKKVKSAEGTVDVPTYYELTAWNEAQQNALAKFSKDENVLVRGQLEARKYEHNADKLVSLNITEPEVMSLGNQKTDMQSIVVIGRAAQDVKVNDTPNGHKVAIIPLAVNHGGDKPSYMDVEVWDNYAETVAKSVKKGSLVSVSGELDLNTFGNQNNGKTSKLRIVKAQVGFLDKAAKPSSSKDNAASFSKSTGAGR